MAGMSATTVLVEVGNGADATLYRLVPSYSWLLIAEY